MEQLDSLARNFITDGFEGAIARKNKQGYVYSPNNYHSSNVLKIKPVFDDEFVVVGYDQGSKGKDVGAVIWICEVNNPIKLGDTKFNVVQKNITLEDRKKIYSCLSRMSGEQTMFEKYFMGKKLTVEYAELSSITNKPLMAKATVFRTYEGKSDPVTAFYAECENS